jgi:hypothetical protein
MQNPDSLCKNHNMELLKLLIIPIFTLIVLEGYSQNVNNQAIIKTDTAFILHYEPTYPQIAKELGLQGTVNAYFEIDSSCNFKNIVITNSLYNGFDDILIRDLKKEEIYYKKENKSKCTERFVRFPIRYTLE